METSAASRVRIFSWSRRQPRPAARARGLYGCAGPRIGRRPGLCRNGRETAAASRLRCRAQSARLGVLSDSRPGRLGDPGDSANPGADRDRISSGPDCRPGPLADRPGPRGLCRDEAPGDRRGARAGRAVQATGAGRRWPEASGVVAGRDGQIRATQMQIRCPGPLRCPGCLIPICVSQDATGKSDDAGRAGSNPARGIESGAQGRWPGPAPLFRFVAALCPDAPRRPSEPSSLTRTQRSLIRTR